MRSYPLLAAALAMGLATAQDLATALAGQDSLSSLVELLGQVPDTTSFLASEQQVTLFAPSNDAIAALGESGAELDADVLDQVLRYHLYQGVVLSGDLSEVPTFAMSYLEANVSGTQVASVGLDAEGNAVVTSGLKAVSQVVTADLTFDNGVIHIIDSVLTIPSGVADTLLAGGLTALAGAATSADLVSTLEGLQDVTMFAPNNDAFRSIGGATADLSTADLISILQYHVISGTVVYSTLLGTTSVPTVAGTFIDIKVDSDGSVFVNNARVINSDVLIGNGVLHVIDAVLNPSDKAGFPSGAGSDSVPFTSGLAATSTKSELSGTTSQVAAVLVTAAPEPTTYLLQNGSFSTAVGSTPVTSGASGAMTSAMSTGSAMMTSVVTSRASASASVSGSASSASVSVAQQTKNAGGKNQLPAMAAAVAFGAAAFAM